MSRRNRHEAEDEEEEEMPADEDLDESQLVYNPDQNADERRRVRRNYRELAKDGKDESLLFVYIAKVYIESLQNAKAIGVEALTQKVRDSDTYFRDGTISFIFELITMLTARNVHQFVVLRKRHLIRTSLSLCQTLGHRRRDR